MSILDIVTSGAELALADLDAAVKDVEGVLSDGVGKAEAEIASLKADNSALVERIISIVSRLKALVPQPVAEAHVAIEPSAAGYEAPIAPEAPISSILALRLDPMTGQPRI